MAKLIYFNENDLVKNFCFSNSPMVDRHDFSANPEKYKECIAVCYGLSNYGEILVAKANNIPFIYIDNCYYGNLNSYYTQKKCRKNFYRVVYNDTTLHKIIKRDDDRFQQHLAFLRDEYNIISYLKDYFYAGENLILVPPSGKVLKICEISDQEWIDKLTQEINQQGDFNIIVRNRSRSRIDRFVTNPINFLFKNAYATITFNSMAAVESLISGIPNFIFDAGIKNKIYSAAEPVSVMGIDNLKNRLYPNNRYAWMSHLAYGQFTRPEMSNGYARDFILKENI